MEFVELGPVMKYDRETNKFTSTVTGGLCEERLAGQYLLDIASGLGYLHLHHIAHRDLKPDNVLLGKLGRCKIADFGVAHFFSQSNQRSMRLSNTEGTHQFWPPEYVVFQYTYYSHQSLTQSNQQVLLRGQRTE